MNDEGTDLYKIVKGFDTELVGITEDYLRNHAHSIIHDYRMTFRFDEFSIEREKTNNAYILHFYGENHEPFLEQLLTELRSHKL